MLPLKQRSIWEKKLEDAEKNTLLVRVEKVAVISGDEVTTVRTATIEICSPAEDRRGQPTKKRLKLNVTADVLTDLANAGSAISSAEWKPRQRTMTTLQLLYEGSTRLVVMYEVTPQKQERYVIRNGGNVRFILGELSDLQTLHWDLNNQGA